MINVNRIQVCQINIMSIKLQIVREELKSWSNLNDLHGKHNNPPPPQNTGWWNKVVKEPYFVQLSAAGDKETRSRIMIYDKFKLVSFQRGKGIKP